MATQNISAKEIFLRNRRFDLIFKYLFLKNHPRFSAQTAFFEDCYAEHIRAFNNFHESNPSDDIPKSSREEFIRRFLALHESIRDNGFDGSALIPVDENLELLDAAHRIAVCAHLGLDVPVERHPVPQKYYDYDFFLKNCFDPAIADYGALEYVRLNPNAYIVNLHAVTDPKDDGRAEAVLSKYGFIFYKKNVAVNFNGYVNLKKLSYGFDFFTGKSWIGTPENKFAGARNHAGKSMGDGKNPLRAYVFVCDDLEKAVRAKKEIRDIYGLENYSLHINDTHGEAIRLAETFFNENSLYVLNNRPFVHEDGYFGEMMSSLKQQAAEQGADLDDFCGGGSTPFSVLGIRESKDLDFLYCGEAPFESRDRDISDHDSQLPYYPCSKVEIIKNPKHHFYHNGLKFITLDVLHAMKTKRNEIPKDVDDCRLIQDFRKKVKRFKFVFFRKTRIRDVRKITFCNITFSYRRKRKPKNPPQ